MLRATAGPAPEKGSTIRVFSSDWRPDLGRRTTRRSWSHRPRRHRSTPLFGAATQIARNQPVSLACSSSHRTSRARASRERSTFIARERRALGGVKGEPKKAGRKRSADTMAIPVGKQLDTDKCPPILRSIDELWGYRCTSLALHGTLLHTAHSPRILPRAG